jgi:hypothetical protein
MMWLVKEFEVLSKFSAIFHFIFDASASFFKGEIFAAGRTSHFVK